MSDSLVLLDHLSRLKGLVVPNLNVLLLTAFPKVIADLPELKDALQLRVVHFLVLQNDLKVHLYAQHEYLSKKIHHDLSCVY